MDQYHFNELAGQIEGLGRMILHLTAHLEDAGLLDGPRFTDGLRHSIVVRKDDAGLMASAQQTLIRVTQSMDEAREWRKFRRQLVKDVQSKSRRQRRTA